MEASANAKPGKRERAHVEYVVLVEDPSKGEGVEITNRWAIVTDDDGNPTIYRAYRATDVVSDVIDEGLVEPDDKTGQTPFVVAVPARSWRPYRATVQTRRQVSLVE